MKTALDIWCDVMGYQGGTIHDALREFGTLKPGKREAVQVALLAAMAGGQVDARDAIQFFTSHLKPISSFQDWYDSNVTGSEDWADDLMRAAWNDGFATALLSLMADGHVS
jgi:hypothetical protein